MPVSLTQEEYYPPHLLAQKLNNRASYLITSGRYGEGIQLLTKALKLTEQDIRGTGTGGRDGRRPSMKKKVHCRCKACSLESCLIMEHDAFMSSIKEYQSHQEQEQEACIRSRSNGSNYTSCDDDEMDCDDDQSTPATTPSHLSQVGSSTTTTTDDCCDDDKMMGFVYQRPLLVNKICIDEMHYMGVTLSLIILFNLALAHHLKSTTSPTPCSPKNLRVLQQALQLYELAYQLHVDYIQQSRQQQQQDDDSTEEDDDDAMKTTYSDDSDDDDDSIINDTTQHRNNNNTSTHTTDTSNSTDYNRSIGSLRFTMIVSNNLGEIHRMAGNTQKHTMCLQHLLSAIMYMVDSKLVVLDSVEMDGFYKNVSPIMLHDICAQAA